MLAAANFRAIKKDCRTPHKADYRNQIMGVLLKRRYKLRPRAPWAV